jgi:hypothetical protein
MVRVAVLLVGVLLGLTSCGPSELEATPAALQSDPDKFDGKAVMVRGEAYDAGAVRYPDNKVYPTFKLAYGGRSILVFSTPSLLPRPCQVTVKGRFVKVKLGEQSVIEATEVNCSD